MEDTSKQTYTYDWESYSLPDAMTHTDIAPGSSYNSKFIFEMPKATTPSTLIFESNRQKKEIPIKSINIKSKYNTAPTANAGFDQTVLLENEVTFDGSNSNDLEGGMGDFEWDFGDESTFPGSGSTTTHTFYDIGMFTVTLTVSDGCGLSDTDSITITVTHYLELTIGDMEYTDRIGDSYPSQPDEGNKYLVISVTITNNDKESHYVYSSDFTLEDENTIQYDTSYETSKVEDNLEGTDIQPGGSITGSIGFEIPESSVPSKLYCEELFELIYSDLIEENYNEAPSANAGFDQNVFVEDEVSLDGSKSTDPEEGDLDFDWEYGDDTSYTGSSEIQTHTYYECGQYTVTLTVTDDCDLFDADKVKITVIHYFELTIIDHGWHEKIGPYDYHEGDYEVEVKLKNVCSETKDVWSTFFELITLDNIGYDWGGEDGDVPDSLGPGASATWTVYFDVPEGKTPVKIIYDEELEVSL